MNTSLLATKLSRPSLSFKRVERCHLIQRLTEGFEAGRQIALVSAPAGFGKTSCIVEWVDALDCPVTWLSLDAADDDPGRFFTYLVAALQKIDETLGREIGGVLCAGQVPPGEVIQTSLSNDILAWGERFLLVLDDVHLIQDPVILHVLEHLVVHPPPALHLVLISREDPPLPLARLRANNQLTEIRVENLRFTGTEASLFLNEVMGLALSQADISVLGDKTEGWIAGLQLAAIAMRSPRVPQSSQPDLVAGGRSDPSGFIANLSGSHRFILSYLTEEVLSQQPQEIQDFLLQTSVLDRLNGDLCDAVTGRSDGRAMLERLFSANLFLIPLDGEGQWYRYHHLFADLLRDLQSIRRKDQTPELHRRASRWYAQAGEQGAFVSEAIQHALAAKDYAMAVDLIESHAMDLLMQWQKRTVTDWMDALPPEWAAQSPKANLAFAWTHLLAGDATQAAPFVERLRAMFSGSQVEKDIALRAEWLALQAMLENAQGKPTEGLASASRALDIVPEQDSYIRSLIYMGLAGAYQQLDDYGHAVDAYRMIVRHGQAAGSFVSEILGLSGLGLMALDRGQLHLAFEIASQGIERIEQSGSLFPISASVYGELGQVCYHWHQLELAHTHFSRAVQLSSLGGYSDAEIYYQVILSRLRQVEGDLAGAGREMKKAGDLIRADAPVVVREEVVAQQVRVYLGQNRLAAAETLLEERGFSFHGPMPICGLASGQGVTRPMGVLYNSGLRILLYRATVRHDLASLRHGIELADFLIAAALQRQYLPVALETLLLRAQMHAQLRDRPASQADIIRALELAEPERFISVFVEEGTPIARALSTLLEQNQLGIVHSTYVREILAAFSTLPLSPQQEPVSLIEPLTDRELDVLRLLASGLKYQGIAQELFISVNTVRAHVRAIYGKLDVNNRTAAIQRSRQLHIL